VTPTAARAFIAAHTALSRAPLVPEIALHLATEITPIWQASETWLQQKNIEPPFWAFAWPGGQALARHALDRPALIRGRRVLDFAAGCGIAAIACAMAGAASVEAAEIDPLAAAATLANAQANGVTVDAQAGDVVGRPCRWDLIAAPAVLVLVVAWPVVGPAPVVVAPPVVAAPLPLRIAPALLVNCAVAVRLALIGLLLLLARHDLLQQPPGVVQTLCRRRSRQGRAGHRCHP